MQEKAGTNCPRCHCDLQPSEKPKGWYCEKCHVTFSDQDVRTLVAQYKSTAYWHKKSPALISLYEDHVKVDFHEDSPPELVIRYEQVESLDIKPIREITALRTFLVGPIFAALWKKEKRLLTIGFRDTAGLVVTPAFDVGEYEGDEDECYRLIHERVVASRQT